MRIGRCKISEYFLDSALSKLDLARIQCGMGDVYNQHRSHCKSLKYSVLYVAERNLDECLDRLS